MEIQNSQIAIIPGIPPLVTPLIRKIAFGGGKGGVGKTVLSLLFGIFLALNEKKVIVIDTDFAGPDLSRLAGVRAPETTLNQFFLAQVDHLKQVCTQTPLPALDCIFCAQGPQLASGFPEIKDLFYRQLNELEKEIVIFDLSSTLPEISVEIFLDADYPILITNNEATAVRQSFAFLKTCIIQIMNASCTFSDAINDRLELCRQTSHKKFLTCLKQILERLRVRNQEYFEKIMQKFSEFKPWFLFNMAYNQQLVREQMAMQLMVEESLGIRIKFLGTLEFMSELRKVFRSSDIFGELATLATQYGNFKSITENLLDKSAQNVSRIRFLHSQRKSLPGFGLSGDESDKNKIICSNRCLYWEKCQLRRGGYLCRVEYIGFLRPEQV